MVRSHGRRSGLSEVDRFKADEVTTDEGLIGPKLDHIHSLQNSGLEGPHDIEIRDGKAVCAGKDGAVTVINLYPRESPTVSKGASFTNPQTVALYPGDSPQVNALIGADTNLYSILALHRAIGTGISSPSTSGSRTNGSAWYFGDSDYLFLAEKSGEVEAFDVSDFNSLSSVNSYTTNINSPHDVAIMGTRVITCNQTDGSTPKIEVLQYLNSTTESVKTSSVTTDTTFSDSNLNGTNRLETLGDRYIVSANNIDNSLSVIDVPDITDSSGWSIVSHESINTPDGPSGLTIVGDYVITASNDRVTLWDISDPTALSQVDQHVFGSAISGHDMAVDGRYCYVTGQASDSIEVFDLGWEFARDIYGRNLVRGSA
jgi:hypothetical protein